MNDSADITRKIKEHNCKPGTTEERITRLEMGLRELNVFEYNRDSMSKRIRELERCVRELYTMIDKIERGAKYWNNLEIENKKLIEFAQLVKECPENATHLMPIAADALLTQLTTGACNE